MTESFRESVPGLRPLLPQVPRLHGAMSPRCLANPDIPRPLSQEAERDVYCQSAESVHFLPVWEEVRNPQSSPEIIDNRSFASAWNNMAFCIWTKGAEVLVDPYSHSLSGQVRLVCTLLADVTVRYENARDKRNRSGNGHFLPDHQLSCRSAWL